MELGKRFYYITNGINFKGLLKTAIIKELDRFFFLLELHKFKNIDDIMLEFIEEECRNNSNKFNEKVDTSIETSHIMSYEDVELFIPTFRNIITNIENNTNAHNITIMNTIQLILYPWQMKRLYSDMKGFYENYMVLDSLMKLNVPKANDNPSVIEKITKIDQILSHSVNSTIKSFIIHYASVYYRYTANTNRNNNIIEITPIFPGNMVFSDNYLMSIILSLSRYDLDIHINKLSQILIDDSNTEIETMICICLIFVYCLAKLHQTNRSRFFKMFNKWISKHQEDILNYYIEKNNVDIKIQITHVKNDKNHNESYLLDISQKEFADALFNTKSNNMPKDFSLGRCSIIDIRNFKTPSIKPSINLFSIPSQMLTDTESIFNILNYDFENEYLTNTFKLLSNGIFIGDSPICKLLPQLSKIVNNNNFKEEENSTLVYYKTIAEKIDNCHIFRHIDLLYVIFQVIIPYYYKNYNKTIFKDYLLY